MEIAIRADGSNTIGMGHIYNSLAVADALKVRGATIYFITQKDHASIEKIQERGYPVESIIFESEPEGFAQTIQILQHRRTKILITDLLEIKNDYSAELQKRGITCISFDILGNIALHSDIIINRTTITKRLNKYKENGKTMYYVGAQFVPLSPQFKDLNLEKREMRPEVLQVLLCFGGGDEYDLTNRVAQILDHFSVRTIIVLGKAFKAEAHLQEVIKTMKYPPLVLKDISNMAEVMLQSDLAICAGGSILYELAITGTPSLVIPMNDHQVENGEEFEKLGSVITAGPHSKISDEEIHRLLTLILSDFNLRKKMCESGKNITDGRGAERAAAIILDYVQQQLPNTRKTDSAAAIS